MADNPMATHGMPSWIEHNSNDSAGARKFYADVLGWNVQDMPMQDGSSYPVIGVGEASIGGFNPRPGQGGWMVYITVDDVDARCKKALEHGASEMFAPMDMPGVGRAGGIIDPQGAAVTFITYAG